MYQDEQEFKYSFQEAINPFCNCSNDAECVIRFFLQCPLYSHERCTFVSSLSKTEYKLKDCTNFSPTQT